MFKILSFLIWLIVITVPLIWFFNNNGTINIIWLGFEAKIDILTFLLISILAIGILFIIYRLFWFIISLFLGLFGIFKTDQLKKKDKEIKKYEELVTLFTSYIKAFNKRDLKDAKSKQKQIHSLIKNDELKEVLITQIENPDKLDATKEVQENKGLFSKFKNPFRKNTESNSNLE